MAPITAQSCPVRLSKVVRTSVKDRPEENEERKAETVVERDSNENT